MLLKAKVFCAKTVRCMRDYLLQKLYEEKLTQYTESLPDALDEVEQAGML